MDNSAFATPITYNQSIAWDQMAVFTWSGVLANDWEQPITPTISVETVRDTAGVSPIRKFVKFLKALRFRQIHYRLEFDTDGSINNAPVRLFSLMTYIRAHQRVSKTIT